MDEWRRDMWHIYNGILFGLQKQGNPVICDNICMLNEVSQAQKDKCHCTISLIYEVKNIARHWYRQ
jgi:hypothetical protein